MAEDASRQARPEASAQDSATETSGPGEALLRIMHRCPLFAPLPAADLGRVLAMSQEHRIMRRETVFSQGDRPNGVYLLTRGRMKLLFRGSGRRSIILAFVGPGEAFGYPALMAGTPHTHAAQAVVESSVLAWDADFLDGLLQRYPAITKNALRLAARQVQDSWSRLYTFVTEPVARRLARALLRLGQAARHGKAAVVPIMQQDLAELLGTTPSTLSRILGKWEARGLVAAGRERIAVLHPEGIVRLAGPDDATGPPGQGASQTGTKRP